MTRVEVTQMQCVLNHHASFRTAMNSVRASRVFEGHSSIANADRDGELAELLMQCHIAASGIIIENKI